ncbi:tRNA-specific adenosine deaminase [Priestia endophytica]|uniref:nucleoside deaminase n=1 Tax=Priestia endophytica TaxID=135735 RepID=UPI000DCA41E6|nr:nucleoside deaminase [Priestia endophytica]RAS86625.1 tRNA-specific adenosine deaminase [Priestia endophytica]
MITQQDKQYLKRCVGLAKKALEEGNEPFGSILVAKNGDILFEDHNCISNGDPTQHPEFSIARWAAEHLTEYERADVTVYTSGEHCPMCAAAHGLVGLGRIVYASSTEQLKEWRKTLGIVKGNVKGLAITEVINNVQVEGPVEELAEQIRLLHYQKNRA